MADDGFVLPSITTTVSNKCLNFSRLPPYENCLFLSGPAQTTISLNSSTCAFNQDVWISVEIAFLAFICVVGSFGNLMVIAAVVFCSSLRTIPNILIVVLAVIDLINTALLLPFFILTLTRCTWPYEPWSCQLLGYLTLFCLGMSVYTVGLIAGNRYMNITKPRHIYLQRCSPAGVGLAFSICLLLAVIAILVPPQLGIGQVGFNLQIRHCSVMYNNRRDWLYPCCLFTFCVCVVAVVIPVFYFLTFRVVYQSRRKICISQVIAELKMSPANKKQDSRDKTCRTFSREELRLTIKMVLIFVVFLVCWMPYCVTVLFDYDQEIPGAVHRVANLGIWTGSCINPYLYAGMVKGFRDKFKQIIYGVDGQQPITGCCYRLLSIPTKKDSQKRNTISTSAFTSCVSATEVD